MEDKDRRIFSSEDVDEGGFHKPGCRILQMVLRMKEKKALDCLSSLQRSQLLLDVSD